MRRREWLVLLACALVGLGIGRLDSRPHWDDTAITAGLLFLSSLTGSLVAPRRAWAVILLTGGWIPVLEARSGNTGVWMALAITAFGGFLGWGIARVAFLKPPDKVTS